MGDIAEIITEKEKIAGLMICGVPIFWDIRWGLFLVESLTAHTDQPEGPGPLTLALPGLNPPQKLHLNITASYQGHFRTFLENY